jgi:dihydrofolate reductase
MGVQFHVYMAQSLDGFIADAAGGVDWLKPYEGGDDFEYDAFLANIDTIVMGRRSYEQILTFGDWPYPKQRTIVLSSTALAGQTPTPNTETYSGPVRDLAARLVGEKRGDVWILGGADTVARFLKAGRVDSLELFIMPELLGDGVRLFPQGGVRESLELVEQKSYPCGVMRLVYHAQRGAGSEQEG